jgi:hypothetical protein
MTELSQDRREAGERCRGGQHQKRDRAIIVDGRALADRGNQGVRRDPTEIPADDQPRRHAPR